MRTDEDRVRTAVRALAEAVPVVLPPAATVRARAGARRRPARRWAAPALAAAAILVLVAVVAVVPGLLRSGTGGEPGDADRPVLPERFADLSGRTATYVESPPGAAIALYHQGSREPAGRDNSQQLLVGADGRTYRRLEWLTIEGAGAAQPWNALGGVSLSPDGSLLTIPGGGVGVIDLATGEVAWHPEVTGGTILAWSPDSRRIAVALGPSLEAGDRPGEDAGVAVLDLTDRTVSTFTLGSQEPRAAAFSPDGELLAIHARVADAEAYWAPGPWVPEGGRVDIFDLDGSPQGGVSLSPQQGLAPGGTAWSPDGSLLTVIEASGDPPRYGFAFLDATGSGRAVPAPIPASKEEVVLLGWRSPTTMLVGWDDGSSRGTNLIAEVPVDGSPSQTISQFSLDEHGWVTELRLASGLAAEAEIRDPGPPSRGPWLWPLLSVWLLRLVVPMVVLAVWLLGAVLIAANRRRRRRRSSPTPRAPTM